MRHRRALSAILAATSVLLLAGALQPQAAPTITVVAAATDLPAGRVLTRGDLAVREWPAQFAAPSLLSDPGEAEGRMTAGALEAGEPVGSNRILGPGMLGGLAEAGMVALSVRLADGGEARLLRPGDVVDLLATRVAGPAAADAVAATHAETVARDARLLAIPGHDEGASDGVLGSDPGGSFGEGALVVLSVDASTARSVAAAAASSRLSVVLKPIGAAGTGP